MDNKELKRNGEHYWDPTAYQALKKIYKSEGKAMNVYEGDIVRAKLKNGSEREFVVLSVHTDFSTVLMLADDESLPYSIKCGCMKYTDPGMLSYVFNDNFTEFIRSMKKDEIDDLMQEVVDELGYTPPKTVISAKKEIKAEAKPIIESVSMNEFHNVQDLLIKVEAERDVYKSMYENLLGSMMAK